MSVRKTRLSGADNWGLLTESEQFRAVAWAARNLNDRGYEQLSPSVERVGFGRRERRNKGRKQLTDEMALVAFVKVKWRKSAPTSSDLLIPGTIRMRVPIGDRRLTVSIPIDVCETPALPRTQATPQGVRTRSPISPGPIDGSVCALVRNANSTGGPHYLLGCHHVIFRSLIDPVGDADPHSIAFTIPDRNLERSLGVATRPATYGVDESGSIDAALVRLSAEGLEAASSPSFWDVFPSAIADDLGELELFARDGLTLVSHHGDPVELEYVRHIFDQPIRNQAGAEVKIAQVIATRARPGSRSTRSGDSGGAILRNNILIAMHVAGIRNMSYAIPAYLLFSPSAFRPRITLGG